MEIKPFTHQDLYSEENGYTALFYENFAANNTLANLYVIKNQLALKQLRELRKREAKSLFATDTINKEQWEVVDAFYNKSDAQLKKALFRHTPGAMRETFKVSVQPGGKEYPLTYIGDLRTELAKATNKVEAAGFFTSKVKELFLASNSRFDNEQFLKEIRDACVRQLESQKKTSEKLLPHQIVKMLLDDPKVKLTTVSIRGVDISGELQSLITLAEELNDPPASSGINSKFLTDPRDTPSKSGEERSILDTIVTKVNGWEQNLAATAYEVSIAVAAEKSKFKINDLNFKVIKAINAGKDVVARGDSRLDVENNDPLKSMTIRKEDASLEIEHHNPLSATVRSTLGLTIKGSGKQVPDLKTINVKLQEGTPFETVLRESGVYNQTFILDLVATAFGLPSKSQQLQKYSSPPGITSFSEDKLIARWRQFIDIARAGMALQVLSGYGEEGDRATVMIANGRVISIRKILNTVLQEQEKARSSTITLSGLESRNKFVRENTPIAPDKPRTSAALIRSFAIKGIVNDLFNQKITFNMKYSLEKAIK